MRTLRILSIILLFIFFASFLIHPLYSINQDIGRHLKSGEIIWQTKSVYKTNLFSFTEPNHPFINHHWLSEVTFYGLNNIIGLNGLIVFKVVVLLLSLWLLFMAVKNKTDLWVFLISAMAGIMIWAERTDVRPEIFSYLFLSYFLFAIFRAKFQNQTKWLYFLPIVQIFWTNMHIYFAIGPILLLSFLIERIVNLKFKIFNLKRELRIFILVLVATLINPSFISGALYPLMVLKNYGYSIVENQNIFFLSDYGISTERIQMFQLSLALLILSFIIRKRVALFELLSGIFFSLMALKMLRNFGPYGMIFIPTTAINLSALKINTKKETVILLSVCAILISASAYNIKNKVSLTIPLGADKAVEFVKKNNIKGPVFNNFDVGSFLIWKMYPAPNCSADRHSEKGRVWCGTSPDFRVFVDGRPEAYSQEFFENIYKPMQLDQKMWEKYSKEYGINYIFFDHRDITPWARTFLARISQDKNWERVYVDEYVVIFVKNF